MAAPKRVLIVGSVAALAFLAYSVTHDASPITLGSSPGRRLYSQEASTGESAAASAASVAELIDSELAMPDSEGRQLYPSVIPACDQGRTRRCCGDGVCSGPENADNCFADCPGVTTNAICGEEPHSDTGGAAVVFGIKHRKESAQACCNACLEHAQKNPNGKPCNSWVFCPLPICWGLDTGWNHTFGECWLKFQADPAHPLFGQRGEYTPEYRQKHRRVRTGPPSHVPWTGGVVGSTWDRSVRWKTGPEGMSSSTGEELTNWRAWEAPGSYEKRLAADLARRRGKRRHIAN